MQRFSAVRASILTEFARKPDDGSKKTGSRRGAIKEGHKSEAGRNPCPLRGLVGRGCCVRLVAGSGGGGGRLRVRLGDADVSADLVLANLVDDYFFRYVRAGDVEENRLVEGAVLFLEALVLDGHREIDLVLLLVDALEFDSDVADLLGLVLANDGEFNVVALADAAELVDFIMVARDESAHL